MWRSSPDPIPEPSGRLVLNKLWDFPRDYEDIFEQGEAPAAPSSQNRSPAPRHGDPIDPADWAREMQERNGPLPGMASPKGDEGGGGAEGEGFAARGHKLGREGADAGSPFAKSPARPTRGAVDSRIKTVAGQAAGLLDNLLSGGPGRHDRKHSDWSSGPFGSSMMREHGHPRSPRGRDDHGHHKQTQRMVAAFGTLRESSAPDDIVRHARAHQGRGGGAAGGAAVRDDAHALLTGILLGSEYSGGQPISQQDLQELLLGAQHSPRFARHGSAEEAGPPQLQRFCVFPEDDPEFGGGRLRDAATQTAADSQKSKPKEAVMPPPPPGPTIEAGSGDLTATFAALNLPGMAGLPALKVAMPKATCPKHLPLPAVAMGVEQPTKGKRGAKQPAPAAPDPLTEWRTHLYQLTYALHMVAARGDEWRARAAEAEAAAEAAAAAKPDGEGEGQSSALGTSRLRGIARLHFIVKMKVMPMVKVRRRISDAGDPEEKDLERRKRRAVEQEDYEEAAKLRNALRKLRKERSGSVDSIMSPDDIIEDLQKKLEEKEGQLHELRLQSAQQMARQKLMRETEGRQLRAKVEEEEKRYKQEKQRTDNLRRRCDDLEVYAEDLRTEMALAAQQEKGRLVRKMQAFVQAQLSASPKGLKVPGQGRGAAHSPAEMLDWLRSQAEGTAPEESQRRRSQNMSSPRPSMGTSPPHRESQLTGPSEAAPLILAPVPDDGHSQDTAPEPETVSRTASAHASPREDPAQAQAQMQTIMTLRTKLMRLQSRMQHQLQPQVRSFRELLANLRAHIQEQMAQHGCTFPQPTPKWAPQPRASPAARPSRSARGPPTPRHEPAAAQTNLMQTAQEALTKLSGRIEQALSATPEQDKTLPCAILTEGVAGFAQRCADMLPDMPAQGGKACYNPEAVEALQECSMSLRATGDHREADALDALAAQWPRMERIVTGIAMQQKLALQAERDADLARAELARRADKEKELQQVRQEVTRLQAEINTNDEGIVKHAREVQELKNQITAAQAETEAVRKRCEAEVKEAQAVRALRVGPDLPPRPSQRGGRAPKKAGKDPKEQAPAAVTAAATKVEEQVRARSALESLDELRLRMHEMEDAGMVMQVVRELQRLQRDLSGQQSPASPLTPPRSEQPRPSQQPPPPAQPPRASAQPPPGSTTPAAAADGGPPEPWELSQQHRDPVAQQREGESHAPPQPERQGGAELPQMPPAALAPPPAAGGVASPEPRAGVGFADPPPLPTTKFAAFDLIAQDEQRWARWQKRLDAMRSWQRSTAECLLKLLSVEESAQHALHNRRMAVLVRRKMRSVEEYLRSAEAPAPQPPPPPHNKQFEHLLDAAGLPPPARAKLDHFYAQALTPGTPSAFQLSVASEALCSVFGGSSIASIAELQGLTAGSLSSLQSRSQNRSRAASLASTGLKCAAPLPALVPLGARGTLTSPAPGSVDAVLCEASQCSLPSLPIAVVCRERGASPAD